MNAIDRELLEIRCDLRDAGKLTREREGLLNNIGSLLGGVDRLAESWRSVRLDAEFGSGLDPAGLTFENLHEEG